MKWYQFLYLFIASSFLGIIYDQSSYNHLRAIGLLTLLVFIVYHIRKGSKGLFKNYILFFFFFCIYQIIYSSIVYDDSLLYMLAFAGSMFSVLAYFLLFRNKSMLDYYKILFWCISVTICIALSQTIMHYYLHLPTLINFDGIALRMGIPRMFIAGNLTSLCAILTFGRILSLKKNGLEIPLLYTVTFLLCIIHLYFVLMVRSLLIELMIIFVIMYLLVNKKNIFKAFIFLCIGGLSIYYSGVYYNNRYSEFSSLDGSNSMLVRYEAMNYYWESTWEHNPITGLGFINPTTSEEEKLLGGTNGEYYREDIGIIGYFNTYGLIGIIWMFLLLFKMYRMMKQSVKINGGLYPELLGMFLLILMGQLFNLNCFYYSPIVSFPLLLLAFEKCYIRACESYNYYKIK